VREAFRFGNLSGKYRSPSDPEMGDIRRIDPLFRKYALKGNLSASTRGKLEEYRDRLKSILLPLNLEK